MEISAGDIIILSVSDVYVKRSSRTMIKVQVICRKCLRFKGRYPWSEGYWYGVWMWWKINFFQKPKPKTSVKKVRILCKKCSMYTFD